MKKTYPAVLLLTAGLFACTSTPNPTVAPESVAEALRISNTQLIRTIEDHRLLGDARLAAFLSHPDIQIREAAATAVGRIGDASLEPQLIVLAADPSPAVRRAAAFSLGLLGGTTAESTLDSRLAVETNVPVRAALLAAVGHSGTVASEPAVALALAPTEPAPVQAAAAQAYGNLIRRGVAPLSDATLTAQLISLAAGTDASSSTAASFALAKLGAAKVALDESTLTAALTAAQPEARGYLATALASAGTATALQTLVTSAESDPDVSVRSAAYAAIATFGATEPVLSALGAGLNDPSHAVEVAAATAIGNLGTAAATLVPALNAAFDNSPSAWVRSGALNSLVTVSPAASHSRVLTGLNDAWVVESVAISNLPFIANAQDVQTLLGLSASADLKVASAAIGAIASLDPSLVTPAFKPAMEAALARNDWELVYQVTGVAVTFGWTDFAPQFNAMYAQFPGDGNMNARLALAWALGYLGGQADVPLLQSAVGDNLVLVAEYAAGAYQQITGIDVSGQVRVDNVVTTPTPSAHDINRAVNSWVVLRTTRGLIWIEMLKETPLNAANFVHLAQTDFYAGLPFHRVIPDFIAQGGDPRSDGLGGTTFVRDEVSLVPHEAGTVGMATAGKDTGSCQLFFNDTWNARLDENYTVFGRVIAGLDVAQSLEAGDVIESTEVIQMMPLD